MVDPSTDTPKAKAERIHAQVAEQLRREGLHDPLGPQAEGYLEALADELSDADLEAFIAYWQRKFELLNYARNSLPGNFKLAVWGASKVASVGLRVRARRANAAATDLGPDPGGVGQAEDAIGERLALSGLVDPLALIQNWRAELLLLTNDDLAEFVAYWTEAQEAISAERLRLGPLHEPRLLHARTRALEGHVEQAHRDQRNAQRINWPALASRRRLRRVWPAALRRASETLRAEGLYDPLAGKSGRTVELLAALTDEELAMFNAYSSRKVALVRSYFKQHAGGPVPFGVVGMTNHAGYGEREAGRRLVIPQP